MFNPKVSHPYLSVNIPQTRSESFQAPFYFGGSQVPNDLGITKVVKGRGIKKTSFKALEPSAKALIAIPKVIPFRK